MSTVEELTVQAMARALEFHDNYPQTRSVLYRRLGVRQQGLFALAARINPEFFGISAVGTLDASGAIDTGLMGDPDAADPVESIELISLIEIEDPGTSAYAIGDEVNHVTLTDQFNAAPPPRVTIRRGVIRQVATDLVGVTKIRVYYSLRPFRIDANDADTVIQLQEPFEDLLVLDLTKHLLRKAATVPEGVRVIALKALDVEEEDGLRNFVAEIKEYTSASEQGRFGRTAGATKQ